MKRKRSWRMPLLSAGVFIGVFLLARLVFALSARTESAMQTQTAVSMATEYSPAMTWILIGLAAVVVAVCVVPVKKKK